VQARALHRALQLTRFLAAAGSANSAAFYRATNALTPRATERVTMPDGI